MIVVGLTGIIGSGKSTVSRKLSELGYPVIDLDGIAQSLLSLKDVIDYVREIIGEDAIKDGKVDRKRLAERVFEDESALRKLESIIHPLVVKIMEERIEELRRENKNVVFVDGPLIFEAGIEGMFDKIVVVYAEEEQVLKRMEKRGFKKDDVLLRLKRQLPLEYKVERAHHVIYNTGEEEDLKLEVERLVKKISEWEVK